jgi:hypothetical protein
MKTYRACLFSCFFGFFTCALPAVASAEPTPTDLSIVSSQFANDIEGGKPVGDGRNGNGPGLVAYYVEVKNPGDAASVVLVWSHDGKETARQTLDVGHSPKWRTWGKSPARGAKSIEVRVLDPKGQELKKDVLERT